jgi:hypothetical protein
MGRSAIGISAMPGTGVTIAKPATAHSGQRCELVACEFASTQKWNCAAIKMITKHNANTAIRDVLAGMYFI